MRTLSAQNLALYLGCEVECKDGFTRQLIGICRSNDDENEIRIQTRMDERSNVLWFDEGEVKPLLRKLESMTEEDKKELCIVCDWPDWKTVLINSSGRYTPSQFTYLLSKHFDLFNYIAEGLALDKNLKDNAN